jgi:hypothetical protein
VIPHAESSLGAADEHQLVAALAELALEQAAPEELVLFPETASEYFRDPDALLQPRRRDHAVGFGLELAMLTPYALAVVTPVVRLLAGLVEQTVAEELKPSVAQVVRRLFRGGGADAAPAGTSLTREQIRELRDTAYERGVGVGLDAARAGLLADSIVGGLVVAGP